jgi:FkbM family methyltransferase
MDSSPKNTNTVYRAIDAVLRTALRRLPLSSSTERIALWWGYRFRPAPCVLKLRSGALVKLTHVDHLQLLLYYFGTFEPHCLDQLHRWVKKGDTFLDVGANIGLFTVEGSVATGPTGRVLSIEAAPIHAEAIREAIGLNNMMNVDIAAVAVGDATGQARLTLPQDTNFGMFTLGNVSGDDSFVVPVRRIDDILAENAIKSVDFIKMDIEGSEYRALLGATATLTQFHPTILIELNEPALNACGSSARQVKDLLREHGYQGWVVKPGVLQPIDVDQAHLCDECLFVHHSRDLPETKKVQL